MNFSPRKHKRKKDAFRNDFELALFYHYADVQRARPQRKQKKPKGYYSEKRFFSSLNSTIDSLGPLEREEMWISADVPENCYERLCMQIKPNENTSLKTNLSNTLSNRKFS
jgi:hypothetical protein